MQKFGNSLLIVINFTVSSCRCSRARGQTENTEKSDETVKSDKVENKLFDQALASYKVNNLESRQFNV